MVLSYASALQINANEWNHVSVSINKNTNTVKFTKDHLEETFTGVDLTSLNTSSSNVFIGYNEEKNNYFKGDIDNVSIYNTDIDKVKLEIKDSTFPVLNLKNIESNAIDASGFGSTATFVNTNVTNTTNQMGKMNNAFEFNGTNSKLLVDNINYDGYKNKNITLSTWVNPSINDFSSVLNNMPILSKDLFSGNLEFGITSDGKIYCRH
jgi:hypothetical protein